MGLRGAPQLTREHRVDKTLDYPRQHWTVHYSDSLVLLLLLPPYFSSAEGAETYIESMPWLISAIKLCRPTLHLSPFRTLGYFSHDLETKPTASGSVKHIFNGLFQRALVRQRLHDVTSTEKLPTYEELREGGPLAEVLDALHLQDRRVRRGHCI